MISEITRLARTATDHHGCPALAVSLRHSAEREDVLRKAAVSHQGRFMVISINLNVGDPHLYILESKIMKARD